MSTTTAVTLKINDLKTIKIGRDIHEYYLLIEYIDESIQVSPCKNIVMTDGIFELKEDLRPIKIEIWNYQKQNLVSTLVIKRFNSRKSFKGVLTKANLSI